MDTLNKLGRRAADEIKRNNLVLFDRHIPPEENISSSKRKNTGISLAMYAIVLSAMFSLTFSLYNKLNLQIHHQLVHRLERGEQLVSSPLPTIFFSPIIFFHLISLYSFNTYKACGPAACANRCHG